MKAGNSQGAVREKIVLPFKIKLIIAALAAVILAVSVLFIQHTGYKRAEAKYIQTVEENKKTIEQLQKDLKDQIAVYERIAPEVNLSVIDLEIQAIGELATVEYHYTDAGKFSDGKQLFGINIPGMTKSFVAKWEGTIKAGIDINQIETEFDNNSQTFTVHLPKAKILSHEIHNDSIETLDQRDGAFNKITVSDVRNFDTKSKAAMEERAKQAGLLNQASVNAEELLSKMIYHIPGFVARGYKLVFDTK